MLETADREEILACIGRNGTIFPLPRDRVHRDCIHHLVVRVFAIDARGRFLVQRRSLARESYPGYYTDSASGHVSFRLELLFDLPRALLEDAARELDEEVGVTVADRKGPLIRTFGTPVYSRDACETSHCFVARVEGKIRPSDEVDPERTRFVRRPRLERMLEKEEFVPVAREIWRSLLRDLGNRDPEEALFGRS